MTIQKSVSYKLNIKRTESAYALYVRVCYLLAWQKTLRRYKKIAFLVKDGCGEDNLLGTIGRLRSPLLRKQ